MKVNSLISNEDSDSSIIINIPEPHVVTFDDVEADRQLEQQPRKHHNHSNYNYPNNYVDNTDQYGRNNYQYGRDRYYDNIYTTEGNYDEPHQPSSYNDGYEDDDSTGHLMNSRRLKIDERNSYY